MCITTRIQNEAFNIAHKSTQRYKHGAVITQGSKIMFTGFNQNNRTKILNSVHTCVHSEIDVINKLIKHLKRKHGKHYLKYAKKYSLYVVRLIKLHKNAKKYSLANSLPCYYCSKKIKEIGLKNIIYSNEDGLLVKTKCNQLHSTHQSDAQKKIL